MHDLHGRYREAGVDRWCDLGSLRSVPLEENENEDEEEEEVWAVGVVGRARALIEHLSGSANTFITALACPFKWA